MEKKKGNSISLFICDDHPLVRSGLKSELQKNKNIKVIGEASSGKEAVEFIPKLKPDIILMDLSMPDMTGIEAIGRIRKSMPKAKIIALTMHENKNYVMEVIRLGGMGYMMKDSDPLELIKAIESVNDNVPYYSQRINKSMLMEHDENIKNRTKPYASEELTEREIDIVKLIVLGDSNKEIAKKLFISVRTVEAHRTHIMKKLDIKSVGSLIRYAIEEGIAVV